VPREEGEEETAGLQTVAEIAAAHSDRAVQMKAMALLALTQ